MEKSLYSLILMDDVVTEIDKIALRRGTSRSGLVNQILADYVSLMTPEKRIGSIFEYIERALSGGGELVPFVAPNQTTMSLKSCLEYKYRPTIKYEVQLYRSPQGAIGALTVLFRTQSQALLGAVAAFFRLWKRLEDIYTAPRFGGEPISCELYDGKFIRSISVPADRDYTAEQLGEAISAYIRMLDDLLKGSVEGRYTPRELEERYVSYLNSGAGLI